VINHGHYFLRANFEWTDVDSNKKPDKIIYLNDDYYNALMKFEFHSRREATGNHRDMRVTLQYGSLFIMI